MDSKKMKKILEERLQKPERRIRYDSKEDKLRVENTDTQKGITLSLPGIVGRYQTEKERAVDEMVYYVDEALLVMQKEHDMQGKETAVYPVIRSTSFPVETKDGKTLVYRDHTAETRIFYALDLKQSYRLIDHEFMVQEGFTENTLDEMARFNLRSLPVNPKKDVVADNVFYFINDNDGYDASRILNQSFLSEMSDQAEGELAVAVPHQDVLIVADIRNKQGYDILAQMTMKFFTNGYIPVTSLPFLYEDGHLEPIFILAKNKPEAD